MYPKPSKEEAEGITVKEDEVCDGENFNHTLVGKIWTDSPYNVRAFKSTIVQPWRLEHCGDSRSAKEPIPIPFLYQKGGRMCPEEWLNCDMRP